METHVTSNGRIVIPALMRRRLGIKDDTRIQVELDEQSHRIILTPITREYVHRLRGKYKGKGILKVLIAEKKRERAL
jgi:AbrB family looped-hinge helix DNA binding protein